MPISLKGAFIHPEEHRLRSGWRLLGSLFLLGACLVAFTVVLLIVQGAAPQLFQDGAFLPEALASAGAITLGIYLARRLLDMRSLVSLGLAPNCQAARDLSFGFILAGMMISLVYLIEWAVGWLQFEGFAWHERPLSRALLEIALVLITFIAVGWSEELLNRGYWLVNLSEGLNVRWAVIISSAVFSLMHLSNPNVSYQGLLGLFLSGLFFAYCYLRTRQLWLPIGVHIGWNFFEGAVLGFPVSGLELYRLVSQRVEGPAWATGGAFGPEAGLVLLPPLALGMALAYVYTRRRNRRPEASSGRR